MKTTITITILVFSILAFNITKLSAQNEILGHTYMGTFEGHAYYLSNCYTTWEQANDAAMQMGGYLSSITSEEEDNFIKSFAPVVTFSYGGDGEILYGAWIGLVQQNGTWTWSNGEDIDYTNWGFNDDIALQEPIQCCYGLTGRVTSAGDFNFWFTSGLYSFYGNRQYIVEFENDPGCNNPNKSYVCHNGNTMYCLFP